MGLASILFLASAPAADAHSTEGVSATNYRSEIVSVSPPAPELSVRLLDLGHRIELVNRSSTDVVVLGYQGEPYRRVGPRGVFENRNSPSVAIDRLSTATSVITPGPSPVDTSSPPAWHKIGDGNTTRWRDHRTRWEGPDPPGVQRSPGREQVVGRWTIPLVHDSTPVVVTGVIRWVPGTSVMPWLGLSLVMTIAVASFAWARRWGPLLSGAVALLVVNDAVHSFAAASPAGDGVPVLLAKVLLGGLVSTLAWALGAWAVGQLQRGRELGLLAAGFTAFALVLYALSDVVSLGRSQIVYAFPPVAARIAVALSLGIGAGLLAAVVAVFVRHPELRPKAATPAPPDRPNPGTDPA